MISESIIDRNEELFRTLDEYRLNRWNTTLRQQHDLVLFGGFSYSDVNKLPLVERDRFMEMTIERKKEQDEQMSASVLASVSAVMGRP